MSLRQTHLGEFLIDIRLLAFYLFICSETRSHFAILASLALTCSGLSRLSAGTTGMGYQIQWHCPWWPLTLLEQCLGLTQYSQRRKSTQQSCWVFCYGLGVYLYFKNLRINSKICHIWSGSDFWRIWGGIRMLLNFRELNTEPSAGSVCGIRMDSFLLEGARRENAKRQFLFYVRSFPRNVCLSRLSKWTQSQNMWLAYLQAGHVFLALHFWPYIAASLGGRLQLRYRACWYQTKW